MESLHFVQSFLRWSHHDSPTQLTFSLKSCDPDRTWTIHLAIQPPPINNYNEDIPHGLLPQKGVSFFAIGLGKDHQIQILSDSIPPEISRISNPCTFIPRIPPLIQYVPWKFAWLFFPCQYVGTVFGGNSWTTLRNFV